MLRVDVPFAVHSAQDPPEAAREKSLGKLTGAFGGERRNPEVVAVQSGSVPDPEDSMTSIHFHFAADGGCAFHRALQPVRFCHQELVEQHDIILTVGNEINGQDSTGKRFTSITSVRRTPRRDRRTS